MKTLTLGDISYCDGDIELEDGLTIRVKTEYDQTHGAPWEECDGHGPVSEWTSRNKRPGERELCSDRGLKRFYDYEDAIRLAKKDGWDAPPYNTGTNGETARRAVEADMKLLREWCNDRWHYIGVIVSLHDENDDELAEDSLWGIESYGNYWREVACENANALIEAHYSKRSALAAYELKENVERSHWEARDTVTR